MLPFKKHDDTYANGVTFADVYKIYGDRRMRTLLFGIVEEIELHLRTQLAYCHAYKYGPVGYLDPTNFNHEHDHERFQRLINDAISNH
ncbi:MAG: Abi family protein [Firmicutes bacterium]|nr:Abi family protein [Bacillota bacterium]